MVLRRIKTSNYKNEVVEVPGAFEIPSVISKLVKKYSAFVALGCIIKGETLNFELYFNAITNGIMEISIKQKKTNREWHINLFSGKTSKEEIKAKRQLDAISKVLKNLP